MAERVQQQEAGDGKCGVDGPFAVGRPAHERPTVRQQRLGLVVMAPAPEVAFIGEEQPRRSACRLSPLLSWPLTRREDVSVEWEQTSRR
jgi:hypothetical protein